jgi:DNA-binding transcriptional LysR family regulator
MSSRLDLTSLRLFVAVCEAKSITRAAELENIAASAISKRIAQLERFAGSPLLVRGRSGASPTKTGATLLEHARNVLYNLDLINRDVSGSARDPRGFVRIFASASAIAEFLPSLVVSFLAKPKHADIDVDIEEMVSRDVIIGVKEGRAAIGVCWAEIDMAGLEAIPYKTDRLSVVVPMKHPLASKRQVRFADTLQYDHAGLRPTSAVTALLHRESARAGKAIRFRVLVSTFEAIIGVVSSGLVIGIAPTQIASASASAAAVRVIPLADKWAERQFAICFRNRRNLSPPAELFVAHLLANLESA